MARRKPKQSDTGVLLNRQWLNVGAAVICVVGVICMVCYFESVNRHVQADRRFLRDPVVAGWYQESKQSIGLAAATAANGVTRRPVALWFGKIEECRTSNPRSGGASELLAVRLSNARLMAGEKGRHDSKDREVIISTRSAEIEPRVGEKWLFSVWRDDQGYSHTKSARLFRPAGT